MNDRLSFLAYITLYELHDLIEDEEEKRRDRVKRVVEEETESESREG